MKATTAVLAAPLMATKTGTSPEGTLSVGMRTLSCHRPAKPGASPLNSTAAGCSAMNTAGVAVVKASVGGPGAGEPSPGAG